MPLLARPEAQGPDSPPPPQGRIMVIGYGGP